MKKYISLLALLLTSCAYNHVGVLNKPGNSNVFISTLPDGKPAITLYQINRKASGIMYFDEGSTAMSLPPGAYRVAIDCRRPGSLYIVDGSNWFSFAIKSNESYVLDCSPLHGANNFLVRVVAKTAN
ncbi:MAG TPA: hypothetical protein VN039_10780 [Nitrospira sp.]|nr:hypothetical protein [Nitrospira sp.]